jgi:hypothetical protein
MTYSALETQLAAKAELHMVRFHDSLYEARKESGYFDLSAVKRVAKWYGFIFVTSPVSYNNALTSIKIFLQGHDTITVTAI